MKQKLALVLNLFNVRLVNGVEIVVCNDDQTQTRRQVGFDRLLAD